MEAIIQSDNMYTNGRGTPLINKIINTLVFALIVYEGWYIEKFGAIPYLLQALVVLLVGFTFLKEIPLFTGKIKLITPATGWFFFGLVAVFVAVTKSYASSILDALFTYFSFFVVCVCTGIACKQDDCLIRKAILTVVLLSIVSVLLDGYSYKNGAYYGITLGANNNPNTLGSVMTIGVYYIINPQKKATYLSWIWRILGAGICLFVVVQTGSRSGLLCYALAVAFTLFFQFLAYKEKTKSKRVKRLLIVFAIAVAGGFLWDYVNNMESGTTGVHRIFNEFRLDAFSGRTNLYAEAWEYFKQHPLFGIGYRRFEHLSKFDFTHSTYMELLSCTGLVGFVLFFYPYARAIISAWQHRKTDMGRSFTILMVFAATGFFGIIYYNLVFMVVLYVEIIRARALKTGENDVKTMRA